jgi:hypothetical protein
MAATQNNRSTNQSQTISMPGWDSHGLERPATIYRPPTPKLLPKAVRDAWDRLLKTIDDTRVAETKLDALQRSKGEAEEADAKASAEEYAKTGKTLDDQPNLKQWQTDLQAAQHRKDSMILALRVAHGDYDSAVETHRDAIVKAADTEVARATAEYTSDLEALTKAHGRLADAHTTRAYIEGFPKRPDFSATPSMQGHDAYGNELSLEVALGALRGVLPA